MHDAQRHGPPDAEVIDVLMDISYVSARLARKLRVLAAKRQSEEGGKRD